MEKSILFPRIGTLIHGGDYNPEQWLDRPDILAQDISMMKKAGINSASLGIFSWSFYEPAEGEYHFDWLEDIMDKLYDNGIHTILATPSGARPAWLDAAYPEAMRVNNMGVRNHHGVRHNHCMSSPKYREKVAGIDRRLAERFASHPGLMMWHISNELGGECFCPHCVKRFQDYLAHKFHNDIKELNQGWWTAFWSHTYTSFDQIEPPFANGEGSVMGLNLEWKRFTTWNMTDFMNLEIDIVKEITPNIPVTANFMKLYEGLDYRKMTEKIDVISWDSYPRFHNDYESLYDTLMENAFDHCVLRCLKKDKPFMLMESAPGLVNWHPYNKLKRPGMHKLFCMQAIACGSDTVQYFQWRKGRGSFEQYHGAVVDHLGTDDTRVFREVAEVGGLLRRLAAVAGTTIKNRAALLFDWDNRWAIRDMKGLANTTKCYEKTCLDFWKEFKKMGVEMDVISSEDSFEGYDVIVAPMLYLVRREAAENLKRFVTQGGRLLATYLTGYVDENLLCHLGGFPGEGLSDLFGIISEEIDTLYPEDRNMLRFTDGREVKVRDYAEILRVKDAQVLASYTEDFYQGTAAVTKKDTGKGTAVYVAARTEPQDIRFLFEDMLKAAGIAERKLPLGVEYHERVGEEGCYGFYLNLTDRTVEINGAEGENMIGKQPEAGKITLDAYETAVLRREVSLRQESTQPK